MVGRSLSKSSGGNSGEQCGGDDSDTDAIPPEAGSADRIRFLSRFGLANGRAYALLPLIIGALASGFIAFSVWTTLTGRGSRWHLPVSVGPIAGGCGILCLAAWLV
jgi:hypothetical protein